MLTQSCLQLTTNPIFKTKGKVKLLLSSISVMEVKMPEIPDPGNISELNFNTLLLPEGVVPLDVMHCVDHKTTQTLKVPILNINNTISRLGKHLSIATLVPAEKCAQVQEVKWSEVTQEAYLPQNHKLLPKSPSPTSLQLEPNTLRYHKIYSRC